MEMSSEVIISWLPWATLAVSLLYCLTIWRRRSAGGRPLPPGPPPLPLIGNLHNLRAGVLHHTLTSLARVHGPVMMLKLGLTTAVVLSSRDAAREAFTKQDRRIAARPVPDANRAAGFADRSMIFLLSSNPRCKTIRGIHATHFFSPRDLAAACTVRERKVRDMVAYFRRRAGTVVDIRHAVYGGVLNLLSSTSFSVDVVDLGGADEAIHGGGGLRELVHELVNGVTKPNVSDYFPFLRALDLQGLRRATERRFERLFSILDDVIDRRLASKQKRGDYLDSLLDLVSAGKITRDTVPVMLTEVFVAGSDTMTVSVEWAMAVLLRNPSAMAKVRAEIKDVLGGKEAIDEADAERLPYLQAAWKETMRLHPVGPLLVPRMATEDGVEIGGYAVPKGSTVLFNAWAIMRDPELWERPAEFSPERFLHRAEEFDLRGKEYFEFTPFGSGRRICPGLPLAERVVPFMLASLLHAFDWRLPDGLSADELDMSETFSTANVRAVPLKAVPVLLN
ncbi:hypothetical protein ABZP36_024597 [Zizania latifolia]